MIEGLVIAVIGIAVWYKRKEIAAWIAKLGGE